MATHFLCGESLDRGAWQATVHGVARVGHNLATKPTNHLFIHSPGEGHLGCFQVLAIVSKLLLTLMCRFVCEHVFNYFG